jgi:hypothetical protein
VPRKYPRDNISENFMAAKQTGSSLREKKGTEGALAELENSKCQGSTQEIISLRISWLQSRQEVLCEKKGY